MASETTGNETRGPAALWHYTVNDTKHGPVSARELKKLAAEGTLSPNDLVWKEGFSEWVPARQVKGLFITATPLPQAASDIATAAAPPPVPIQTAEWYYANDGEQRQGPLKKREMLNLIEKTTIHADTLVWKEGMAEWIAVVRTELWQSNAAQGVTEVITKAADLAGRAAAAVRDIPMPGSQVVRPDGDFMSRLFWFDAVMLAGSLLLLLCGPATWGQFGPVQVSGFNSDGMFPALLGGLICWLTVRQVRHPRPRRWCAVTIRLSALVASTIGMLSLANMMHAKGQMAHPSDEFANAFSEMLSAAVQPGSGMYLAVVGGVAVLAGSFAPILAAKWPSMSFLMSPVRKRT